MPIKADRWIRTMALEHDMITPFVDHQVREAVTHQPLPEPDDGIITNRPVISYGLSSYGYDIRIGNTFKLFTNIRSPIIDPKALTDTAFVQLAGDVCIIPPNSYILAESIEHFKIPRNILAICVGKSSYARAGIIVNVTPFEPEWEGTATLEISNGTTSPAKIYAHEGIVQVLFFESDESCEISYADKCGRYQHQRGITLPRL